MFSWIIGLLGTNIISGGPIGVSAGGGLVVLVGIYLLVKVEMTIIRIAVIGIIVAALLGASLSDIANIAGQVVMVCMWILQAGLHLLSLAGA